MTHLYPVFREKLQRALDATHLKLGAPWRVYEGYRSPERQTYLFASGRTRPGPVVTWMRTPKFHGVACAADCYPVAGIESVGIDAYRVYRDCCVAAGLSNPVFGKGDLGHCQLDDPVIRQQALAWVRAGFQDMSPPHSTIQVYHGQELIPDAAAYLDNGHVWAALRPLADSLDLVIASVDGDHATLVNDTTTFTLPLSLKGKRGFSPVYLLPVEVTWDAKSQVVRIVEKR